MTRSPLLSRDLPIFLRLAEKTARAAGKILLEGFDKRFKISYKGRIDPVTE
jgi:hypothetical protein